MKDDRGQLLQRGPYSSRLPDTGSCLQIGISAVSDSYETNPEFACQAGNITKDSESLVGCHSDL